MAKSIFSRIIDREIPAHIVAEDSAFIAFLDINPLSKGHTLIVPKEEVDYFFDQSESTLAAMMVFSKKVADAIRQSVNCKRVGVAVIGFEVPHAHLHLVPMNHMGDIDFSKPKLKFSPEEFAKIAEGIRGHLK
jgi:histidine triad (HIT) family protein